MAVICQLLRVKLVVSAESHVSIMIPQLRSTHSHMPCHRCLHAQGQSLSIHHGVRHTASGLAHAIYCLPHTCEAQPLAVQRTANRWLHTDCAKIGEGTARGARGLGVGHLYCLYTIHYSGQLTTIHYNTYTSPPSIQSIFQPSLPTTQLRDTQITYSLSRYLVPFHPTKSPRALS